MPDKYEREIEDILRNLKGGEPPIDFGRARRRSNARRGGRWPQLSFPEWCLLIGVVAALFAGGWAYIDGGNVITGFIGLIGAVCIALTALSSFITKQRPSSPLRRY